MQIPLLAQLALLLAVGSLVVNGDDITVGKIVERTEKEKADLKAKNAKVVVKKHKLAKVKKNRGITLPGSFDPRIDKPEWKDCTSIWTAWNQGACGTCWAMVGVGLISNRLCIASGGKIDYYISAAEAIGCTAKVRDVPFKPTSNCKVGGQIEHAFKLARDFGIAKAGCVPYTIPLAEQEFDCRETCLGEPAAPAPSPNFIKETIKIQGYEIRQNNYVNPESPGESDSDNDQYDELEMDIDDIKEEVYTHGPVGAKIVVYADFMEGIFAKNDKVYETPASKGVWPKDKTGKEVREGHGVRIIGWIGDAWLVVNSWGPNWGKGGTALIRMSKNILFIETEITWPTLV